MISERKWSQTFGTKNISTIPRNSVFHEKGCAERVTLKRYDYSKDASRPFHLQLILLKKKKKKKKRVPIVARGLPLPPLNHGVAGLRPFLC